MPSSVQTSPEAATSAEGPVRLRWDGIAARRAREGAGLSRETVAQYTGQSAGMLRRYERCEVQPRIDVAARMAAAYGVPLTDLMTA
ncbi:helix-turn-helix domain-containing protein [Kineococcus radiotolerans]|uniref:Helix-turn-helix domain protein n=1 Tax=Kineococcus radiotolerans (strain ATCC BAA-149 / DSM 14245 / SRS30216) TaxID=266940 RepID=A6WH74_KINRD|nr:helix-turn-helix transcriptional regulator [Kineococcus radiotolerans]ABS06163.1 helix-turn-helix domain protein [Kineococcus radiotolerans SRS30216 = ATCC BAA-149]